MPYDALLAALARGADCRRRQVGAIVTDPAGHVVGRGWNGLRGGSCKAGECPRGLLTYEQQPAFAGYEANCEALHAEVSALLAAGERAAGGSIYVTCEPCPGCAEAIQQAGVHRVIVQPANIQPPSPARG